MMRPQNTLVIFFAACAAASPAVLRKRCSPIRDEAYQGGYLPPVPCWLTSDPACQAYIPAGTVITVDEEGGSATVTGVSAACASTIAEEQARERDGRKTYGWTEDIGTLSTEGEEEEGQEGVLRITGMSAATVEEYLQLRYEGV